MKNKAKKPGDTLFFILNSVIYNLPILQVEITENQHSKNYYYRFKITDNYSEKVHANNCFSSKTQLLQSIPVIDVNNIDYSDLPF